MPHTVSRPVEVFVLDDDVVARTAIHETLSCLGPVRSTTLWSEIAGPLMRSGRDRSLQALLVCGLSTPSMAGPDFCRIVRRHQPRAKIIVFATEPPPGDLSADVFLPKAEGLEALLQCARLLLEEREP